MISEGNRVGQLVPLPQHEKTDGTMVLTGKNNPLPASIESSNIMQPVDIQSHYQQTVQTHTGAMIAPGVWSTPSTWVDCAGFDNVALNMSNDATTATRVHMLWSNDGVTGIGTDYDVLPNASGYQTRSAIVGTKARYCKPSILNGDAAPHTMSAWVYLKA